MPPLKLDPLPSRSILSAANRSMPPHPQAWEVRNERPWKYIVLHHSATDGGSAESFDASHRSRGWDELGYHFVICNGKGSQDGQIQIGSRWEKQKHGAHTGGTVDNEYNELGIGICLVGNFENSLPSRKQLASLHRLVTYLRWRYKIPAGRVIGHQDAPHQATKCPGALFHKYVTSTFRQESQKRLAAIPEPSEPAP
jgi:N-acetyl-anhydromuramyl-L-alanine amidase AmpD